MGGRQPDLTGVRLKLDRAKVHIDAIRAKTERFVERDPPPFGFRVEQRELSDGVVKYTLFAIVREQPPRDFAPMIGDALHNIRSALDHLVYELAPSDVRDSVNTQFPIYKDEAAYRQRGEKKIPGIVGDERTLIERVQPWHASPRRPEADPLEILRTLSNRDKHRLLVPVIAAVSWKDTWVESDNASVNFAWIARAPVEHDAKIVELTAFPVGDDEMIVQPKSGLHLTLPFAHAPIDPDRSLDDLLRTLHHYVAHTVIDMWFKYRQLPLSPPPSG
jgi:hypothetical protein